KGRITYLGAVLDADLMKHVIDWAADDAQLKPEFSAVPAGVEVCRRIDGKRTVFVLINHNLTEQNPAELHITLPEAMRDLLHDGQAITSVDLAPQGVAVLEADGQQ
ncbi:MAG: beta-galactosidase, partial [Terracidiphilus sp.]